jgi:hypothetical protein
MSSQLVAVKHEAKAFFGALGLGMQALSAAYASMAAGTSDTAVSEAAPINLTGGGSGGGQTGVPWLGA